jgi:putative transcriptional regulator
MSSVEYILYTIYFGYNKYRISREERIVIEIRVDELLAERGRTFYWLAKETGISHSTLWRLKTGRAVGINFPTLEQICRVLRCQPGDVLRLANEKKRGKRRSL